jgi:hypothetical protein
MINKSSVPNLANVSFGVNLDLGNTGDSLSDALNSQGLDVGGHSRLLIGLDGSLFDPFPDADGQSSANHGSIYQPPKINANGSGPGSEGSASGSDANHSGANGLGGVVALFDRGQTGGGSVTPFDGVFFAKGGNPGGGGGGGSGGAVSSYLAGSADAGVGYDIQIDFKGTGWTSGLQTAFTHAADYFVTVITADLAGSDALYRGKLIDDLYITAEVSAIDGTGGILGQAGPTATWTQTQLTAAGQMKFDVADATNFYNLGLWDDIVTHEMMHVLGFGSLWNFGNHHLVDNNSSGQPERYIGEKALAAYRSDLTFGVPGAAYIPVETDGGSGTAGSHWDDLTLTNELMTGYIGTPTDPYAPNVLSEFSVMSLADLGYTVGNYQAYTDLPPPLV